MAQKTTNTLILGTITSAALIFAVGGCHSDHHAAPPAAGHAAHGHHGHDAGTADRPEELELPEDLASVLRDEMQFIDGAMTRIGEHLERKEAAEVAELGRKIHGAFILTQNLTPEQMQTLVAALPAEFVEMDQSFHAMSLHLAEKADLQAMDDAQAIYSKMSKACDSCHGRYARERFPDLANTDSEHHGH